MDVFKDIIVISGSQGTGKTTLANHLLNGQCKGFTVRDGMTYNEIKNQIAKGRKNVIFVTNEIVPESKLFTSIKINR